MKTQSHELGFLDMNAEREYHIGIAPGELPERVLLPGDPDRAREIATRFFDNPQEVAKNREYWSFRGTCKGVPIGVCSTGIGCPSAAIALEELIRIGCTKFLRVGTAGAIDSSIETGSLVIFTAAVRDDGTSKQYVPVEFPAVASPILVNALIKSIKTTAYSYRVGIGHSKDAFYSEHPDLVADPAAMRRRWDIYRNSRVLATEMEAATLFVLGQIRGVEVGAICMVIGEPIEHETRITEKPPIDHLVEAAIEAIISI